MLDHIIFGVIDLQSICRPPREPSKEDKWSFQSWSLATRGDNLARVSSVVNLLCLQSKLYLSLKSSAEVHPSAPLGREKKIFRQVKELGKHQRMCGINSAN